MKPISVLKIEETATVLQPDQAVAPIAITPALYEQLDRDFDGFKGRWLMIAYQLDKPWPNWERHPAGDEIVYLLSGDVEFALHSSSGEQTLRLSRPGEYIIVPKNTWHTARPHATSHMLFITPGEGTEHRNVGEVLDRAFPPHDVA